MVIILRPIGKKSWSGVVRYRHCYEDLAPYFTRTGRIYTGLTKVDEERLGAALNLDLSQNSEFWSNFFIRTTDKDLYLNTEDPMDELRYLFLKNHRRVKASVFETKASANFVLINKEEEAKKANLYSRVKREAIKEFDLLTPEDMRKCLRLFGHSADDMNGDIAERLLYDIVEGNPQGFLDRWVNNKNRETEVVIEKAISANVIRRNKNVYSFGSDIIARSMDEAVDFMNNPKNQDIKIAILRQIEAKKSITIGTPIYQSAEEDLPTNNEYIEKEENVTKVQSPEFVDEEELAFVNERKNKRNKSNNTI